MRRNARQHAHRRKLMWMHAILSMPWTVAACSFVDSSQGLSVSQQYFSLTTNQHQPGLSTQKPTSEHALKLLEKENRKSKMALHASFCCFGGQVTTWDFLQATLQLVERPCIQHAVLFKYKARLRCPLLQSALHVSAGTA